MQLQPELKRVPLKEIKADPKQPRKYFDEEAIKELAANIKIHDVLQPILLRPAGNKLMIVYGERRFRAAQLAGIASIPATIKEMSDAEALEIQLIENLHRKDPHPMEEAVAFKSYLELKQYTIEEIAAKLGKKVYYIKQRLKLNDLIAQWQKLFFQNSILVMDALKIAQLPTADQESFYTDEIEEDDAAKPHFKFTFNEYMFNKYKGELHKANFDLSDKKLNEKAGACTHCRFNTAFASLFPEDGHAPRCTNISCFNLKTKASFDLKLNEAKNDSTIVFVKDYSGGNNSKTVKELAKKNIKVLKRGNDYSIISEPEKPDWEEFKDDNEDDVNSLEELQQDFQDELKNYDNQLKEYQKKIATGKFQKAFVVDGDTAGKYVFVEIKKSAAATAVSADPNEAIRQEVERIRAKEEDAVEQDNIIIHTKISDTLRTHEPFTESGSILFLPELITLAVIFFDYSNSGDVFKKTFKVEPGNKIDLFKKLNKAAPETAMSCIHKFLRHLILSRAGSGGNPLTSGSAAAVRKIAEQYFPAIVADIEKDQRSIANKRAEAAKKKIAELDGGLDTARMKRKGVKSLIK